MENAKWYQELYTVQTILCPLGLHHWRNKELHPEFETYYDIMEAQVISCLVMARDQLFASDKVIGLSSFLPVPTSLLHLLGTGLLDVKWMGLILPWLPLVTSAGFNTGILDLSCFWLFAHNLWYFPEKDNPQCWDRLVDFTCSLGLTWALICADESESRQNITKPTKTEHPESLLILEQLIPHTLKRLLLLYSLSWPLWRHHPRIQQHSNQAPENSLIPSMLGQG